MSPGGASQTATTSLRRHAGDRQFLTDQDRVGRSEHVAIARGPVESPVFPVADPHPDEAVGTDQLGIDTNAMLLDLTDQDPASDGRARRGRRPMDRQLAHPEREDHVALLQAVESPAAQQVRERVQGDRVACETAGSAAPQ